MSDLNSQFEHNMKIGLLTMNNLTHKRWRIEGCIILCESSQIRLTYSRTTGQWVAFHFGILISEQRYLNSGEQPTPLSAYQMLKHNVERHIEVIRVHLEAMA